MTLKFLGSSHGGWIFMLLLIGMAGCGGGTTQPLDVTMTASVTDGVAPLDVTFTATAVGGKSPISYSWDFGDGSTISSDQNPNHTFQNAGEFKVTLLATDSKKSSATKNVTIKVVGKLDVAVAADHTVGVLPFLVTFSSTVKGGFEPYQYSWDFGDGQVSDRATATHLFQVAGTFNVVLTVTDSKLNSGQGQLAITANINHIPTAAITANPTLGVAPLNVAFKGTVIGGDSPFTYSWTFGDGQTASTQDVNHTFTAPGAYTVVFVVTDKDGDQGTATVQIQVASNEVPAVQIQADTLNGIEPLTVHFTGNVAGGNAPITFAWDLNGDGQIESSIANPIYTYSAGTYQVKVTVTDANGDKASDTVTVTVQANTQPVTTATANPDHGVAPLGVAFDCQATGINLPNTFRWDFGDGQISALQAPSHTFTQPGDYLATCTVTDKDGDQGSGSVPVKVAANLVPTAVINANPLVGVAPLLVNFHASVVSGDAPFTYSWDFGDGGNAVTQDASHTFANPGSYTVILVVTDSNGDQGSDRTDIMVTSHSVPVVQISADPTTGIEPLLVRFTANVAGGVPPLSYAWDFNGDGSTDSQVPNPITTFSAGDHTVSLKVTDSNSDTASDTIAIHVDADTKPNASASANPTSGLAPLTVSFNCSSNSGNTPFTFTWDYGNGQTSNLPNPSYTYTLAGDYLATCTVMDANGDRDSATVPIHVIADLIPVVDVRANPTAGLAPLSVAFTCQVTSGNAPFTYAWAFGDGGISTLDNPSHLYTTAGTFQATLMVTDSDGDTAQALVVISVGDATMPAVTVTPQTASGPAPFLVSFTCGATGGNPPYTYSWAFGDGTSTGSQNPTHTYTQIGDYLATCTVTDKFGQIGQGSSSVHATNPNLPPVIDGMTLGNGWVGTDQSCAAVGQTTMQLTVTAHDQNTPPDPLTFLWSFDSVPPGSTATFNNANVMNPTFVPDKPGRYVARVRVDDGRGGVATQTVNVNAEVAGRVNLVSPIPAPDGVAGKTYPQRVSFKVLTHCGIPVEDVTPLWSTTNGWVDWTSGPSIATGQIDVMVTMGCSTATPAIFTAYLPDDPDSGMISIHVVAGAPAMAAILPNYHVPVHDAAGKANPMNVVVQVSDGCGNPAAGQEVTFDIVVAPGSGACFNDLCPIYGGVGVKTLAGRTTTNGAAQFQLFDRVPELVQIWLQNVSGNVTTSGGMALSEVHDFESGDDGFLPGTLNNVFKKEWQYGIPNSVPPQAHSGRFAWDTVLNGNYDPEDQWDVQYLSRQFSVPCTGGLPVILSFWDYHDIGANVVGYLAVGDALTGVIPPAADSASMYNSEVGGHAGYGGQSGGWREVSFDLSRWNCQNVTLFWSLFLKSATLTAPGWTVDDVSVMYFSSKATSDFVPGAPWDGVVSKLSDGVIGCNTGAFEIAAWDQFGNPVPFAEMTVVTDGSGTKTFTKADPGWIVSQNAGSAVVNLGLPAQTSVWFTDSAAENVTVTMITANPANDPSALVTFVDKTSNEVGLCHDGLDNDCDGVLDCNDPDCAGDPACTLKNGSFETGDYTDWTLYEDPGNPTWGTFGVLTSGTVVPSGSQVYDFFDKINVTEWSPGLPITYTATQGNYVGLLLVNGPQRHRMYQTVTIPPIVTRLSWDMAYNNWNGSFNPGSQYLALNIRDPATDAVLATPFKTTQGVDPQVQAMRTYSVDISAFAGKTVRIDFEAQVQMFFFDVTYDNFRYQ